MPTAAVEVRDGMVWVAARTRYPDGEAHWRNRLRAGLEHTLSLVIAKAVLGRLAEGAEPRDFVREAVLFGVRHRDGWGTGLTILTALANLLPFLPEEETFLALYQGLSQVATDCDEVPARRDRPHRCPQPGKTRCGWQAGCGTGPGSATATAPSARC